MEKKTWKEFQDTKLLWWINRILHTFGWAIVYIQDDNTGEILEVYPARVGFRGFDYDAEEAGFEGITKYIKENIDSLLLDVKTDFVEK
ncbi:MAG: hypothetical protein WC979_06965 [Candidatus Pacearchaeota archaeon]|jgi:hypothetical protein